MTRVHAGSNPVGTAYDIDVGDTMNENMEDELKHFGDKVSFTCALEHGGKLTAEQAYQQIKQYYKELKKVHKVTKKG